MNYWILLVIVSALLLTGQDLIKKRMLQNEHARKYTTTRYLVLALLGFLFVPFLQTTLTFEILFILYLASVGACFGILYLTRAIKHMDISVCTPLTNIMPAFLLLFAFLFLREKPALLQIGGIFLLLVGAYLLEIRPHTHRSLDPLKELIKSRYMHYLLFSIIVFAMLAVFEKYYITNFVQPLTYFFFFFIFTALNFLFLHWYRFGLKEIRRELSMNYAGYIFGGIFSVGAAVTYFVALMYVPVTLVIPLRRSTTLFTTLLGGRMFKEENSGMKALACGIMILGAYLILAG